ncbi:uncharacterized protein TNCV_4268661 [Trichonephila clavipes]|nr:uncharacterized protein TNCV_4268661 [Trichonephila clavipes]
MQRSKVASNYVKKESWKTASFLSFSSCGDVAAVASGIGIGLWLAVTGSSPVPLKARRVGQRCTLNLSRAETSSRWCGVVVRRPAQVSSTSLDHGSKLRGPSPKALV